MSHTVVKTSDPQMLFIQQLLNQDINRTWQEQLAMNSDFTVHELVTLGTNQWAGSPIPININMMTDTIIIIHSVLLQMQFELNNDVWTSEFIQMN